MLHDRPSRQDGLGNINPTHIHLVYLRPLLISSANPPHNVEKQHLEPAPL